MSAIPTDRPGQHTWLAPHAKRQLNLTLLYVVLILGGVAMCFPFVWMILTSFKTYGEAIATPPTFLPQELSLIHI